MLQAFKLSQWNIRDLQGIFKGLLEDQHKNWLFNEKSVFYKQ